MEFINVNYAGIGSRNTPNEILNQMFKLASTLSNKDFILRSGGAEGADFSFENGSKGKKEIYLPWQDFNHNPSPLFTPHHEAYGIAAKYHPSWITLSKSIKHLMARNVHQILGSDLNTPSKFVVCWTPDGAERKTSYRTGGTGQAIRIANGYKIPVYNLYNANRLEQLIEYVKDILNENIKRKTLFKV